MEDFSYCKYQKLHGKMYVKMTADSGIASLIFAKADRSTAKQRINYAKERKSDRYENKSTQDCVCGSIVWIDSDPR